MKALKTLLIAAATMLALLPLGAWAQSRVGLAGTDHDFSSRGGGVGLCTFCHTPHRAVSTLLLWNHRLSLNPTFSWDVPASTAGTTFPTFANTYSGPTAKCLSCHDGSVAIGDIAWWNGGAPGTPLDNTRHGAGDNANVGLGGSMAGNHPVAMPYPYQNAANTYNGVTTGSGAVLSEWQPTPLAPVRLYNDNAGTISAGPAAGRSGIECSSCHDPHNRATEGDFFLRGQLTGSTAGTPGYICLKCHVK